MKLKQQVILFLATGGFTGYIPKAPGTFGSLVGILIFFALSTLNGALALIGTLTIVLIGVWIAQAAERLLGKTDPGCIVIDEIAGMCVALIGMPLRMSTIVTGFVLFRLLDIFKPPPIRTVEQRLTGGWAIVMDDVLAGAMANILSRLAIVWY